MRGTRTLGPVMYLPPGTVPNAPPSATPERRGVKAILAAYVTTAIRKACIHHVQVRHKYVSIPIFWQGHVLHQKALK